MYPLYWTKPVEGVFLCAIVMNLKESVLNCIEKAFGLKRQMVSQPKASIPKFGNGLRLKKNADLKL